MDDIICKYLTGNASEHEKKAILKWLGESEENRKYFYDLRILWGVQSAFANNPDLLRLAAFMRGNDGKIKSAETEKHRTSHRPFYWVAAAAVVVAVAIGALLYLKVVSPSDIYRVYENNGNMISSVKLDDGTQVWLNPAARLTITKAFGQSHRRVTLSGSAFFDVARNDDIPFVVCTRCLLVKALGTTFSVDADDEASSAEVILKYGSVRLQTLEGVNLVTLRPDQRAVFDTGSEDLAISQVDASRIIFSRFELVTMPNVTLHEIISHIETTYHVRISVPERYDSTKGYAFSYQYSSRLEDVIKIVEYMTGHNCEVIPLKDKSD